MTSFDKYILITGGAGFIGSHYLNYVVKEYPNYHFTCIDKLTYVSDYSTKLIKVLNQPNFTFIEKDLSTDLPFLQKILVQDFKTNKIDHIVHFAAESCVDKSFDNPLGFTTNNILATQNLLECCRLLKQQDIDVKFLHISTDEVYGEQLDGDYVDENSKLNPTNPYSASKAAIDMIIRSYIYSYKLPITILRSNNVYGANQYPEKIVPTSIQILNRRFSGEKDLKIPVHGTGKCKRTYLHVADFVTAIDFVSRKQYNNECFGEIYNIGGEITGVDSPEIENLQMIRYICDYYLTHKMHLSSYNLDDYIQFVKDRNYNDSAYSLDCTKIAKLGWRPTISLQEGIEKVIDEEFLIKQ